MLTGSNVNPVDLAVDGSGMTAYLVANTFAHAGDVNDGGLYPYTISSAGALSAGTPVSLPTGGPVVAQSTYGPNLYVLIGVGGTVCCGDTVASYSIGSQGELMSVGSTRTAASGPSGMVLIQTQ